MPEMPVKPAWGADPVPEQERWQTPEDARGWRRIYRGTGQKRRVQHSVVLDLTPEQWNWLNRTASARGAVLHDILSALIEDARLTEEVAERRASAERA
jgi:macrodomain Ter protein organizer (MatP/YcbG family)